MRISVKSWDDFNNLISLHRVWWCRTKLRSHYVVKCHFFSNRNLLNDENWGSNKNSFLFHWIHKLRNSFSLVLNEFSLTKSIIQILQPNVNCFNFSTQRCFNAHTHTHTSITVTANNLIDFALFAISWKL